MAEPKNRRLVVLISRDATDRLPDMLSQLRETPGVEISSESKSHVDVQVDEAIIDQTKLNGIVREFGGELHALSKPQIIDPIPTKKLS